MALSESERKLRARIAAHTRWSKEDPATASADARRRILERFDREVDPDGILPADERERRAAHARKAYFAKLALLSAQARKKAS